MFLSLEGPVYVALKLEGVSGVRELDSGLLEVSLRAALDDGLRAGTLVDDRLCWGLSGICSRINSSCL